jgi:hypothetical protein
MIEINGDGNEISGCVVEGGYHGIPIAIKGGLNHYRNNWIEFDCKPDGVALLLEDAWMSDFDRFPLGPGGVVRMRNCRGVRFGEVWLTGDRLTDGFDLDEQTGGVEIDSVNCAFDCGGLDDPKIHPLRIFSRNAKQVISCPPFRTSDNWAAPLERDKNSWLVQWTDGTTIPASIQPKPDHTGYRLRIDIPDNGKTQTFRVIVPLNVPADFVGCTPFASWRADAPPGQNMIVYCQGMDREFFTRSTGSLTATRFPRPIKAGGELAMYFHHARPGMYYVSDVRVGL